MGKYDSYVNADGIRISKATGKPVKKYRKLNKEYWAAVPQKPYLSLELEFHIFVENEIRTALALLAGSSNNE